MADTKQTTIDGSEFKPQTSDEWATPQPLFDSLNNEFDFTLDPCCNVETAKCEKYYTIEDNGLRKSWKDERVFVNCPYSDILTWMKKIWIEINTNSCELVVALLPAWTDIYWFHEFCYHKKAEIRFLQGRVRFFINGREGKSPRFGSMVVIWRRPPIYDHSANEDLQMLTNETK